MSGRRSGRTTRCRHGRCLVPARQHHHARAHLDAGVQVRDVLVGEPDAARGYEGPDGGRLIGAVNAINGVTEIKRARAERVAIAAGHEARKIRLALDHLLRWIPIGPFRLPGNSLRAGPGEALAADANPVAQRLALAEHEIEIGVRRIDDDRAGRLLGVVVDQRAPKLRRQFLPGTGLGPHLGRQRHHVTRIAITRIAVTRIDVGRSGCVPWCGGFVKPAIGIERNGLVRQTLRRRIGTGRIVLRPSLADRRCEPDQHCRNDSGSEEKHSPLPSDRTSIIAQHGHIQDVTPDFNAQYVTRPSGLPLSSWELSRSFPQYP